MTAGWGWMLAGGVLVLAAGILLRRAQARFVAGLRAAGDPLAAHPGSKPFRQKFAAWLFGIGKAPGGPALGRTLVTLVMAVLVGLAALWSLLPGLFG